MSPRCRNIFSVCTLLWFISCSAVELGTDMLELDCHMTKDEQVVVSHDANLRRSSGIDGKICNMSYSVSVSSVISPTFKYFVIHFTFAAAKRKIFVIICQIQLLSKTWNYYICIFFQSVLTFRERERSLSRRHLINLNQVTSRQSLLIMSHDELLPDLKINLKVDKFFAY